MHVITFYSFKGGVGRSMAMVNVAAELAKQGRRVLMVDFDLEAPGLSSFNLTQPQRPHPGVVEFISHYLETREVPDVSKYLFKSNSFEDSNGSLFIMPAGCQDESYQSRFGAINWQTLYDRDDGYLLMEDMRLQWKERLNLDYVFIDSRTGYTDIAGICTRQLPDAVCLIFTPNRQNLAGMAAITAGINAQKNIPSLRRQQTYFVASNVPSLDDDESLLATALGSFSKKLGYDRPTAIIEHHSSFALLNEAVFTLEYPNSKLAQQYRMLASKLVKDNFQDKVSAIDFLKETIRQYSEGEDTQPAEELGNRIAAIQTSLGNDRDALYWLSRLRKTFGNLEESRLLLDLAIEKGLSRPRAYLDRAILKSNAEADPVDVLSDINKVLNLQDGVAVPDLLSAVRIAFRCKEYKPEFFMRKPAIESLSFQDFRFFLLNLDDHRNNLNLIISLADEAVNRRTLNPQERETCLGSIGKAYVALGELRFAAEKFQQACMSVPEPSIESKFNLAMVNFWTKEEDVNGLFLSVLMQIQLMPPNSVSFNTMQCAAFAHWVIGDQKGAQSMLARAKQELIEKRQQSYSCWRYLTSPPGALLEDIAEMERLFRGETVFPFFLKDSELFSGSLAKA